jgi:hypothetical protein
LQVGVGYVYKNWNAKVVVDNVTDKRTPIGFTTTLPLSFSFQLNYKF